MTRAFTDRERETIRRSLLDTGGELFLRRGLRSTTVEEIARGAGISKGAFYLFFRSKEALLLALVEEIESQLHERIESHVVAAPREAVRMLLRASLRARDEHPLAALPLADEVIGVLRTMSPEEQEAFLHRDVDMATRIRGELDRRGVRITVEPVVLAGLLRALVFVGLHGGDIGPEVMPMVEEFLVDGIARSLLEPVAEAR